MAYKLLIAKSVEKELKGVPSASRARIQDRILRLKDDPRPRGTKKLEGENLYRLRVGVYRVIYSVSDEGQRITILAVGHRREIYG